MQQGNISQSILKRSVLRQAKSHAEEVIVGAAPGEDAAVITPKDGESLVCSIRPVTYSRVDEGYYAVHAALNEAAAMGAKSVAVLVSALLPPDTDEAQIKSYMAQVEAVCEKEHVQAAGGHTQISDAVTRPVLTVTGIGLLKQPDLTLTADAQPGLDLVVTKWIGLEATSILAKEHETKLLSRYPLHMIETAQHFDEYLSAASEAATAVKSGACAMHHISQGGIFAALWELADASGVGLDIDLKRIPVRQETVEICEFFTLNPYEIASGGSMLIAAKDGHQLVETLRQEGICSAVIGKTTDSNDKVIHNNDEVRYLEPSKPDQLYQIY
jgi:hydrogenase maturation factor